MKNPTINMITAIRINISKEIIISPNIVKTDESIK